MPVKAIVILAILVGRDESTGLPALLGPGWTVRSPDPEPMALQALIYIPRERRGSTVSWRLQLLYADGEPVSLVAPVPGVPSDFAFEGNETVAGLDDSSLTTPLTLGPIISLPPFRLPKGREYFWRLWVDAETRDEWTAPFRTTPPAAAAQRVPSLRRVQ